MIHHLKFNMLRKPNLAKLKSLASVGNDSSSLSRSKITFSVFASLTPPCDIFLLRETTKIIKIEHIKPINGFFLGILMMSHPFSFKKRLSGGPLNWCTDRRNHFDITLQSWLTQKAENNHKDSEKNVLKIDHSLVRTHLIHLAHGIRRFNCTKMTV